MIRSVTFRLCWILWFICEIFMLGKRRVTCNTVWFSVLLPCSFHSYWKISCYRRFVQQCLIFCLVTLNIAEPKHEYFGHFNFIISFVGILQLYYINLDVVNLFVYSSFTFLTM